MSYLGTTKLGKMYLGDTEIGKAYLGSNLVFQKGGVTPSRLPAGYTELQYVTFNNSQYCDTGLTPDVNWKVETHFNRTGTAAMWVYGVETSSSNHNNSLTAYLAANAGSGNWRMRNTYASMSVSLGEHTSVQDKTGVVLDSNTYSYGASVTALSAPATLTIGGNHYQNGTVNTGRFSGHIYSFRIYVSNVLSMDLVPCTNPQSVPGFYDLIGEIFIGSSSGTPLVAGPVV